MYLFRIAKDAHVNDLSGHGARLYSGRWHLQGTGVIYTSESRALACLEYLVHVPISIVPAGIKIAAIEVPDKIVLEEIPARDLPSNWKDYPAPEELGSVGTDWVKSNETLLLRVPSALIAHEYNILINPSHEDMRLVRIRQIDDFRYDDRLTKRRK